MLISKRGQMHTRVETTQMLSVNGDLLPNRGFPVPRAVWVLCITGDWIVDVQSHIFSYCWVANVNVAPCPLSV